MEGECERGKELDASQVNFRACSLAKYMYCCLSHTCNNIQCCITAYRVHLFTNNECCTVTLSPHNHSALLSLQVLTIVNNSTVEAYIMLSTDMVTHTVCLAKVCGTTILHIIWDNYCRARPLPPKVRQKTFQLTPL